MSGSKMAPTTAGHFGHSVFAPKGSLTRVPTQITCRIFKQHPAALRAGVGGAHRCAPFGHAFRRALERGRKYSGLPSSVNLRLGPFYRAVLPPRRIAARAARGAQYSPDWGPVNALSPSNFGGGRTARRRRVSAARLSLRPSLGERPGGA